MDGWWDGKHTRKELIHLLKEDPWLGVGLRLGRPSPGMPWFVEILVKNHQEARPALKRLFERYDPKNSATWRDKEGKHRLLVGDERLECFGQVVAGGIMGGGGNPHYAGLEIRLGSKDPATSLVVLPPKPLGDGRPREASDRPRRAIRRDVFSSLSDRFYADLEQFALVTNFGADEPGIASALPESAEPVEPSAPRPKRSRKVVVLGGPEDHQSVETSVVALRAEEPQRTPCPLDLESMAAEIREEIRAGNASMSKGLEHFRRAGELLHNAKLRIGHGGYEEFVREQFGGCLETANKYKRIFLNWSTVEEMCRANPASEPDLTFTEILKRLTKPRKKSEAKVAATIPEAIDEVVPEASALSTELFLSIPSAPCGETARTDQIEPRTVEPSSDDVPAVGLRDLPAGDSIGPALTEPADPHDDIDVGDDRARRCDAGAGDAIGGIVATEESRRRAENLVFLFRRCPIRGRLEEFGNTRHFDADARLWRLLQPLADEIRAPHRPAEHDNGWVAKLIGDFVFARSPDKWNLCPDCNGAGVLERGREPCSKCAEQGYQIWG